MLLFFRSQIWRSGTHQLLVPTEPALPHCNSPVECTKHGLSASRFHGLAQSSLGCWEKSWLGLSWPLSACRCLFSKISLDLEPAHICLMLPHYKLPVPVMLFGFAVQGEDVDKLLGGWLGTEWRLLGKC